ncbi:unnamed protein product [Choristocarpus tenellus]
MACTGLPRLSWCGFIGDGGAVPIASAAESCTFILLHGAFCPTYDECLWLVSCCWTAETNRGHLTYSTWPTPLSTLVSTIPPAPTLQHCVPSPNTVSSPVLVEAQFVLGSIITFLLLIFRSILPGCPLAPVPLLQLVPISSPTVSSVSLSLPPPQYPTNTEASGSGSQSLPLPSPYSPWFLFAVLSVGIMLFWASESMCSRKCNR